MGSARSATGGCGRRAGAWLAALTVAAGVAAATTALPAFGAHNARMDVSPTVVEPGGEITVEGLWGFPETDVRLRWGGLDGDVIATLESDGTFGPESVTVPDAEPGTYVLVADQDVPDDYLWGKNLPARAQVQVAGAAEDAAEQSGATTGDHDVRRLAALQRGRPPGTAALVGVAVATAVIAWGLAAGVAALLRRRASTPSHAGRT